MFLTNSVVAILASPDAGDVTERLERPQRGMYRYECPGELGVEFHYGYVAPEWARKWPVEEIWCARRRA